MTLTKEDYLQERSPEALEALARERGCTAVFANASTVQVDLDSDSLERFHTSYGLLREMGYLVGSTAVCWRSRSGNWHIVVTLRDNDATTAQQRIMFALMLGSDPTREILNMAEERAGDGTIVLFRPMGAIEFNVDGRAPSDKKRESDEMTTRWEEYRA